MSARSGGAGRVTLGWGIVGSGRVSRQMATALQAAGGATLQALLSRNPAGAERFAHEHRIARTYPSIEELVVDPDVDIVYVASPNGLHRDHVLAAAAAGKHVLCEKPMANDPTACLDMIVACRRTGVELGIGFQYRQHPAHISLRELVASGGLGIPICADAAVHVPPLDTPAWYADSGVAGGGVLPMSGVHRLDLLRFVLGDEVKDVASFIGSRDPARPYEDTVAAILRFEGGAVATVRFALGSRSSGDGVSVHGSRGWATGVRTTSQWWSDDPGELAFSTGGDPASRFFPHIDLYLAQATSFMAAVHGTAPVAATGLDGLRAAEITAALVEAARRGAVVPVRRLAVPEDRP